MDEDMNFDKITAERMLMHMSYDDRMRMVGLGVNKSYAGEDIAKNAPVPAAAGGGLPPQYRNDPNAPVFVDGHKMNLFSNPAATGTPGLPRTTYDPITPRDRAMNKQGEANLTTPQAQQSNQRFNKVKQATREARYMPVARGKYNPAPPDPTKKSVDILMDYMRKSGM